MDDLSSYLVKQFAAITNDKPARLESATVYGKIQILNDEKYAIIDGSDVLTPVTSTVEVKDGDRVVISLKDHTATVTGNLSDPSASMISVDKMGIHIRDTIVTFENDLANGKTTIDGGCIKTGKIDAKYLNLTGAISFNDLAEDAKTAIENATPIYQYSVDGFLNWHDEMTDEDYYRRESFDGGVTWSSRYQFRGKDGQDGSDADVPNYIRNTYIDASRVESFYIKGNRIEVVIPKGSGDDVGFILTSSFTSAGTHEYEYMRIHSFNGEAPYTVFDSPAGCYAQWKFDKTLVYGTINFSAADVEGLYLTFS